MAATNNLMRMSRVGGVAGRGRAAEIKAQDGRRRYFALIAQAQQYWLAMQRWRVDRERNKRYLYGDQWGDLVRYKGKWIPESAYIQAQGNIPLKNNLIRRLVRSLKGLYRNQNTEPTCLARERAEQSLAEGMSVLLQTNMQGNEMRDLRAQELEEFCISGLVVERKWYGWRNERMDCWNDIVPPLNFIIDNNMVDPRGWDCGFVGQIHDISFEELCTTFAHGPGDVEWLDQVYAAKTDEQFAVRWTQFGYGQNFLSNMDFFMPQDEGRCRVLEVWRRENKPRYRCHDWNSGEVFKVDAKDKKELVDAENDRRMRQAGMFGMPPEEVPLIEAEWFIDSCWMYYFLSPFGDVLDEGETPFEHKSHPYVFKAYPFIDGEIHSFVSDVIDQQRSINRMIIMTDMSIRAGAKGIMMVPMECIPDGMSPEEFAEESTSYRGVVYYRSKGVQHVPSIIQSNSSLVGVTDLLKVEMQLMEDISGVHGALQGQTPTSGTSGTLYAQQTQNASISLVDILESFAAFERNCAYKELKNIQQFYDERRIETILGARMDIAVSPEKIRDVDFDIAITESKVTPVYRAMANEMLMQLWQAGAISAEQLLTVGDYPFADKLLQEMRMEQERQAQQMGLDPSDPRARQQAAEQAQAEAQARAEEDIIDTSAARSRIRKSNKQTA